MAFHRSLNVFVRVVLGAGPSTPHEDIMGMSLVREYVVPSDYGRAIPHYY